MFTKNQLGNHLIIDGVDTPIDHTIALRWHMSPEGKSIPTLYKNGKRVTKAWTMVYAYLSLEDPNGSNANTN
jgi:hypothetical protein